LGLSWGRSDRRALPWAVLGCPFGAKGGHTPTLYFAMIATLRSAGVTKSTGSPVITRV